MNESKKQTTKQTLSIHEKVIGNIYVNLAQLRKEFNELKEQINETKEST
jgi:phage shock protein A